MLPTPSAALERMQKPETERKALFEAYLRYWYGNEVKRSSNACFHCLVRGKVCHQWHKEAQDIQPTWLDTSLWDAFDHTALYRVGNDPLVFVTQPYGLDHALMRDLVNYCDKRGLRMEIDERASYHNPGSCIPILIWNQAVRQKHWRNPQSLDSRCPD